MNVVEWKVQSGADTIAQVLSFVKGINQTKVTSKSLDGTVYIQTIGTGTSYSNMSILATRAEMALVNTAEASGAVVSVVYRDMKYIGYIEAAPSWETVIPGEWYRATMVLLIQEEVAV